VEVARAAQAFAPCDARSFETFFKQKEFLHSTLVIWATCPQRRISKTDMRRSSVGSRSAQRPVPDGCLFEPDRGQKPPDPLLSAPESAHAVGHNLHRSGRPHEAIQLQDLSADDAAARNQLIHRRIVLSAGNHQCRPDDSPNRAIIAKKN
jgi:hypothetical protein